MDEADDDLIRVSSSFYLKVALGNLLVISEEKDFIWNIFSIQFGVNRGIRIIKNNGSAAALIGNV